MSVWWWLAQKQTMDDRGCCEGADVNNGRGGCLSLGETDLICEFHDRKTGTLVKAMC